MRFSHDNLLAVARIFGLNVGDPKDDPGLCHGFTAALLRSIMQGKFSRETFFRRLQCLDGYRSDFSCLLDDIAAIKEKVRCHQALTESEQQLLEIPAFLEAVILNQGPRDYPELLAANLEQSNFLEILPFTASKAIEEQPGVRVIAEGATALTQEELTSYFSLLEEQMEQCEDVAIEIACDNHTVGLYFDNEIKRWIYCDINNLQDTDNGYQELGAKGLSQALFQSFDDEGHSLFSINFYAIEPYPKQDIIASIRQLQQDHLTNQTIARNNTRDESLFDLASRLGQADAIDMLLSVEDVIAGKYQEQLQQALCTACQYGHLGVVKVILSHEGIDVNAVVEDVSHALGSACCEGKTKVAKYLVEQAGASINLTDNNGETALYRACNKNQVETVDFLLLQPGININQVDIYAETPLFTAAKSGHDKVVELLLRTDSVDIFVKDREGYNALGVACKFGHATTVRQLLDKYRQMNRPMNSDVYELKQLQQALCTACQYGHLGVVKVILSHDGIDVNSVVEAVGHALGSACCEGKAKVAKYLVEQAGASINLTDGDGETALYIACNKNQVETVEFLLQQPGVNINQVDIYAETPLFTAAKNGHDKVVELLLRTDSVDIFAKDREGYDALHAACKFGHATIVRQLLDKYRQMNHPKNGGVYELISQYTLWGSQQLFGWYQFDINANNLQGESVFFSACKGGHDSVVKLLSSRCLVAPNHYSTKGDFPLYVAAKRGHHHVVKRLLGMQNIDSQQLNARGRTAIYAACRYGHHKVVNLLLKHEIKKSKAAKVALDLLFLAVKYGHVKVLKTLLEHSKIDINCKNDRGHSLLYQACKYGQPKVVKYLLGVPGINPNLQHRRGKTALFTACEKGNRRIIRLLLEHSHTNVNIANDKGITPVSVAKEKGHKKSAHIIEDFLENSSLFSAGFFDFCNEITPFKYKGSTLPTLCR